MLAIVAQVQRVTARMTSLAQLNLELAKVEGKKKATALGVAAGLGVVAGLLALYALGFLFAAAAVGLNEELALWLSLLIVAIVLLAVAAVAGLVAVQFAKKASPPVPTQAIEETKLTVDTVRGHV